jgi:transcriptional regulator with XRE-family HTH domain
MSVEKKNSIISSFLNEHSSKEVERFVDQNLEITEQIYAILEEKGWSQKDLAKALHKKEAEVSRWLSGNHNFTLRSLAKIEAALDRTIILTPQKAAKQYREVEYVTLRVFSGINKVIPEEVHYNQMSKSKKTVKYRKMIHVA